MIHHDAQYPISKPWNIPTEYVVHVSWPCKRDYMGDSSSTDSLYRLDISWALNRTRCKAKLAGLLLVSGQLKVARLGPGNS